MTRRTPTTQQAETGRRALNAIALRDAITDRLRSMEVVTETLSTIVSEMAGLAGVAELATELHDKLEETTEQIAELYRSMLPASIPSTIEGGAR